MIINRIIIYYHVPSLEILADISESLKYSKEPSGKSNTEKQVIISASFSKEGTN